MPNKHTCTERSRSKHLKIYRKHRPSGHHHYAQVPEIRLCGNWLRDLGFKEGKSVKVVMEKGQLIVTLAKKPKTPIS
jgi:toxic protein SymE